MFGQKYQDKAS
jgi:hypothetical protein